MAETLEQLDVKYVESEKNSLVSSKKIKELTTTLQVRKKKQEQKNCWSKFVSLRQQAGKNPPNSTGSLQVTVALRLRI
jgi:hypothetical protein